MIKFGEREEMRRRFADFLVRSGSADAFKTVMSNEIEFCLAQMETTTVPENLNRIVGMISVYRDLIELASTAPDSVGSSANELPKEGIQENFDQ